MSKVIIPGEEPQAPPPMDTDQKIKLLSQVVLGTRDKVDSLERLIGSVVFNLAVAFGMIAEPQPEDAEDEPEADDHTLIDGTGESAS